ncbi:MAG: hypothetical protein H6510_04460 [Acidobacteria bacterium]|nr:hypothetical protein [Acidobacteriota bacterium]MCB9397049.1 hypothetical protein [Acidobacteriota bacterium]
MEAVNLFFLTALFEPFWLDERLEREVGDLDDPDFRDRVVSKIIKPYFDGFDGPSKSLVKSSLMYLLTIDKRSEYEKVFQVVHAPILSPTSFYDFFFDLWKSLFPVDQLGAVELSQFRVNNDPNRTNWINRG